MRKTMSRTERQTLLVVVAALVCSLLVIGVINAADIARCKASSGQSAETCYATFNP